MNDALPIKLTVEFESHWSQNQVVKFVDYLRIVKEVYVSPLGNYLGESRETIRLVKYTTTIGKIDWSVGEKTQVQENIKIQKPKTPSKKKPKTVKKTKPKKAVKNTESVTPPGEATL